MNWTSRTKQLCYAIRVKETVATQHDDGLNLDDSDREPRVESRTCVKLRTGQDVAPILKLLSVEYEPDLSPPSEQWQQRSVSPIYRSPLS